MDHFAICGDVVGELGAIGEWPCLIDEALCFGWHLRALLNHGLEVCDRNVRVNRHLDVSSLELFDFDLT